MEWLLSGSKPQQLFSKPTQVLIGLGVLFFAVGLGLVWQNYQQPGFCLSSLPRAHDRLSEANNLEGAEVLLAGDSMILVDMEGAVKNPGVYRLASGSVILDAINAAGGLSDIADQEAIKNRLNLAQKVGAGEKLIIPSLADQEFELAALEWCQQYGQQQSKQPISDAHNSDENLTDSSGLVSINTATAKELESLSGIGQKRAEAIITNRPYQSVDELVEKKVISENLFKDLSSQLTL